jgi:hypothetical protein
MIIFGARSMESVRSTGIFNCPRCGPSKPYQHKSVNRWFTLYFIPVIPMGSVGAYVQCAQCGATYGEAVRAIGEAYHEATGTPLPAGVIENDLRGALAGKVQLGAYARPLAQQLTYEGKALFLRAAFRVLCAKGPPRSDATTVIGVIAEAVQISTAQVKQILG